MFKNVLILTLITAKIFTIVPLGSFYEVTNTNDSGPGSLREAIQHFNEDEHFPGPIIHFRVPGVEHIHITLQSNIIVNNRGMKGWIGSSINGNKLVTIQGPGFLIINSFQVELDEHVTGMIIQTDEPSIKKVKKSSPDTCIVQ